MANSEEPVDRTNTGGTTDDPDRAFTDLMGGVEPGATDLGPDVYRPADAPDSGIPVADDAVSVEEAARGGPEDDPDRVFTDLMGGVEPGATDLGPDVYRPADLPDTGT